MYDYDVLTISDFRLPGGTNHSTAQELAVHKNNGLRTGLIQSNSRLTSRAIPWASVITDEIEPGWVEPVLPGTNLRARIALLRHPIAVESMPDLSNRIKVDSALIIANQPALKPDGTAEYDTEAITDIVKDRLGIAPKWAPIGPVVRRTLESQTHMVDLLPYDWTNIFAQQDQLVRRSGFDVERPKIGRHSRPQPAKWPDSADEILWAYPDSDEYEVRILGGAKPAYDVLGRRPENWIVHPFGAIDPVDFLRGVDFWVYFHHPKWLEAYGRAIMEALRSGTVVILPEYLQMTYGNAAVYGRAEDVTTIIDEFRSGVRNFGEQSARGQDFASRHAPEVHLKRITELTLAAGEVDKRHESVDDGAGDLLEPVSVPSIVLPTARMAPADRYDADKRPRALFVTSNGAGMGHLTRMLGIAREVADLVEPVFFSMSQGVNVVANAGFAYEYVPFNSALQTKSVLWHEYFESRLLEAIDHYQAEIIIFDGTWPYRGMLSALDKRNLLRVWIRRAMWKPTISPEQLANAEHFDLIIEPGEHAHSYDVGATTQVRNATIVEPMTVLSQHEVLSRSDALDELGLSKSNGTRYVLVTLGAGNINDLESTQAAVLAAIKEHKGWIPILTKAPIVSAWHTAETRTISTFPLARYSRAFDFAVSAAGYNSFSEWMSGRLPAVWIPNMSTMTDDQDARARWAADSGYGLRAEEGDGEDIVRAVSMMCNGSLRSHMEHKLSQLPTKNGTLTAASLIEEAWKSFEQLNGVRR